MRWPIRNQILFPFAAILLIAVAVTSLSAAYLAARRSEQAAVAQLNRVIDTLGRSNFPYSENVLLQMRGLSGAEFVALDAEHRVLAATLPETAVNDHLPQKLPDTGELESIGGHPAIELEGVQYRMASVAPSRSSRARVLLVLYPETSWRQARRDAALPPLFVGGVTLLLLVLAAAGLAHRLSSRIRRVQHQVADIAAGDFGRLDPSGPVDEIRELIASVNIMGEQLQEMQRTIAQTARAQLLGQLAGGLAHQLRNSVTGARLAIEIHKRRQNVVAASSRQVEEAASSRPEVVVACNGHQKKDDSLDVALRQLRLTEEQVKGLLSVGRQERREPIPCGVGELVSDVTSLVKPACQHARVEWNVGVETDADLPIADSESLRTAVLNLALNAIEATGSGGQVDLNVTLTSDDARGRIVFSVVDDGPGPPPEMADRMFDLFETSKPEGVGFGLALAKQAAEQQGGSLTWLRSENHTEFRLEIPESTDKNRQPKPDADIASVI